MLVLHDRNNPFSNKNDLSLAHLPRGVLNTVCIQVTSCCVVQMANVGTDFQNEVQCRVSPYCITILQTPVVDSSNKCSLYLPLRILHILTMINDWSYSHQDRTTTTRWPMTGKGLSCAMNPGSTNNTTVADLGCAITCKMIESEKFTLLVINPIIY